jgi:hypothetical protein
MSIFDLVIAGDLMPHTYLSSDKEYALSQVLLENFKLDTTDRKDNNNLDQLAFAIQFSKRGDFHTADRFWTSVHQSLSTLDPKADIITKLEYAAHLVRKNLLAPADSIYQEISHVSKTNKK